MDYRQRIYSRYTQDHSPGIWLANEDRYKKAADSVMRRLAPMLPANRSSKILDVGCGAGLLLYGLKARGYSSIHGIDTSAQQVATAQKFGLQAENVTAREWLSNKPNSYDCITCIDVIEHLTKAELFDFIDSLYQALKPGGLLLIQTPNAESPWGMKLRYGDLTHELSFDPECLRRTLLICGFSTFSAHECGPLVHGVVSLGRWVIWKLIRSALLIWNYAEVGERGSGIYTRVFIATAHKP